MIFPVQITFRHMAPSPAVESRIREECEWLGRYFPRIVRGRITVETPHRQYQRDQEHQITIHLHVPHGEIVVNHEPSSHATPTQVGTYHPRKQLETQRAHEDVYVCIRDTFLAARRQLGDYAKILRGNVKSHPIGSAMATPEG